MAQRGEAQVSDPYPQWDPTPKLRFVVRQPRTPSEPDVIAIPSRILQQLWVANGYSRYPGRTEWRDVPVEAE